MNKSIILLSGGLDSLVCFGLAKDDYNIELALTFDYGQKSAIREIEASVKITEYYGTAHKVIKLDWLKDISDNALTSADKNLPQGLDNPEESVKSVWIPNRNGLFLNIAAAHAEAGNYSHIIIGANKEEASTFPDNSQNFIDAVNNEFRYSTMNYPQVIAPLINLDKNGIVGLALKHNIPLDLIYSCYDDGELNCGKCESCTRLKNALIFNDASEYVDTLFNE